MSKKVNKPTSATSKRLIIGRKGFEKISAVEGIRMSREMKGTFATFDKKGTSAHTRRSEIVKKYGK